MYQRLHGAAAEVPRATVRIRPLGAGKNASMRRCKRENTLKPADWHPPGAWRGACSRQSSRCIGWRVV